MAEAIVTTPDGRRVRITGPTREGVEQRARALAERGTPQPQEAVAPAQPAGTATEAGARSAVERLFDNLLAVPELVAQGIANIETPTSMLESQTLRDLRAARTGQSAEPRTVYEAFSGSPPPDRLLPLPTGEHITATGDVLAEIPGAVTQGEPLNVGERFGQAMERGDRLAEEHPTADLVGGLLGDTATLIGGRAPFARGITRREQQFMRPASTAQMEPGLRRAVTRALNSPTRKAIARGAGRAGETGLEGAALAILRDGDPAETAAYAAGGQLAGSGALGTMQALFRGGLPKAGLRLAGLGAAGLALIQTGKSIMPGGMDRILESAESSFNRIGNALIVGALAGLSGAGRYRSGKFAEDLPEVVDALATLPRGPLVSLIRDWRRAEERGESSLIERTLNWITQDPEHFGEHSDRVSRAMTEESVSLYDTVTDLMDNSPEFRARLEAEPEPPAADAQEKLRADMQADTQDIRLPSAREVAQTLGGDTGSPRRSIAKALGSDRRASEALGRLNKRQRLDALEVQLATMINDAQRREGTRMVIDPERLENAWNRLPGATRQAYSEPQRDAIERFIGEASRAELSAVPPLLARSLMTPNGKLARRLRGDE